MDYPHSVSRRTALKSIAGASVAGVVAAQAGPMLWAEASPAADGAAPPAAAEQGMAARALGRTGHQVKLFSLGGQATLEKDGMEKESVEIVNRALDLGVNYIDTAAAYGKGVSQRYIGQVMKTRRKEAFLATKTHNRTYDGSMHLLEESLKSLQTDRLDLWQLHNLKNVDELDRIFAAGGAIKALEKARDEKMVRFLGVTGHYDPTVLLKAIERFPFDVILMALNAADKHNHSFSERLLPVAVEKKMGIIGMKVPARGGIFQPNGITTMQQAMGYVLTLPVSTVIIGIDNLKQLEENVRIATQFKALSNDEMAKLEELTRPYYAKATYFRRPA